MFLLGHIISCDVALFVSPTRERVMRKPLYLGVALLQLWRKFQFDLNTEGSIRLLFRLTSPFHQTESGPLSFSKKQCPLLAVSSTGRRNTGLKSLGWCFVV